MMADTTTAQRELKEVFERLGPEYRKETEDVLQTLRLFMPSRNNHTTLKKKDAVLNSGIKLAKATDVHCVTDPPWVLAVLQKHTPHLQVLELHALRMEHLQAAMRMPQLRELSLKSCDGQDPLIADPTTTLLSEVSVGGLQKLVIGNLPWLLVVSLLTTHRLTLRELRLETPHRWPLNVQDLREELAAPFRATLPRLQKLSLRFPDCYNKQSVDEQKALKVLVDERFAEVLTAARDSLEELELFGARWKHMERVQDLPQLQKLNVLSIHTDLVDQINQVDLADMARRVAVIEPPGDVADQENQANLVDHAHVPALRECKGGSGLRAYWSHYYEDQERGQVTQRVLSRHRHTLEEVDLGYHITPEHLQTIQTMPQLRKLRLEYGYDLVDFPTVLKVEGACLGLRSLTTDRLPNATVISLLSLYAQSLEEVHLADAIRGQLLAVIGLPNLRRLQVGYNSDGDDCENPIEGSEVPIMRLERLEENLLPAETSRRLLAASRDTLQELELHSPVTLGLLLEVQRMPALRKLHIHCFSDDLGRPGSPLPRPRMEATGGLRLLHIHAPSVPSTTMSCLLMAHSRTLEDVCLVEATRDELLVTLRMQALRRLEVLSARMDLREATQLADLAVGVGGVQWMRLGESHSSLPLGATRWLLTAHRQSLRHVELGVVEDQRPEGVELRHSGSRDLPRLFLQCGLKRLETLVLCRSRCESPWDQGMCRKQVTAIRQVLPRTVVRCSRCDYKKEDIMC